MAFIEDFSEPQDKRPPVQFKIDEDVYQCSPIAPAGTLMDLAKMAEIAGDGQDNAKNAQAFGLMADFLDGVMMPESAVRFSARLRNPMKPITVQQVMRIVRWLTQVYSGKEGSAPSSPSPIGQGPTGLSSTGGAHLATSTPGSFS